MSTCPSGLQLESLRDSCQVRKREQEICLDGLYLQYRSLSTLPPQGEISLHHQPYRIVLPTKQLLSRQSVESKHEPQTQLPHTIRRLGCGAPDSVTGYDG